jgi:ABC-type phosphate transport system substrate-binding protein
MKKLIKISFAVTGFLLLSSFIPNDNSFEPQIDGGLAVVVNSKGAPAEMPLSKLKVILKGEQQRWKDGTKITLAFMKTSTGVGEDMAKRIFGMTSKELNKYFLSQVFQGKMSSPQFFDSEEDLLKYIKNNDGTIGVTSFKNASGTTMTVDGKKAL